MTRTEIVKGLCGYISNDDIIMDPAWIEVRGTKDNKGRSISFSISFEDLKGIQLHVDADDIKNLLKWLISDEGRNK